MAQVCTKMLKLKQQHFLHRQHQAKCPNRPTQPAEAALKSITYQLSTTKINKLINNTAIKGLQMVTRFAEQLSQQVKIVPLTSPSTEIKTFHHNATNLKNRIRCYGRYRSSLYG